MSGIPGNSLRHRTYARNQRPEPQAPPSFFSKIPRSFWIKLRMVVLGLGVGTLFWFAISRAYELQTDESDKLSRKARDMYARDYEMSGARGIIYDRDSRELAVSLSVDSIFVDPFIFPEERSERQKNITLLADALKLDPMVLSKKIDAGRRFVWLKRFVLPEEAEKVRALGIPGVDTVPEYKRFYPNRDLASHLLGFTTLDGQGEGIENAYQTYLEGTTGSVPVLSIPGYGKVMTDGAIPASTLEGNSLVLTLSSQIQFIAERELQKAISSTKAKGGTVVVTDPNNGEILAIANWPKFNPNTPGESAADHRRNRAVTDSFEPGSTIKSFVYAAGIEEGLITPDGVVDCGKGQIQIGKHTINDSHAIGVTTWTGALAESSNVCAYRIGQKLTPAKLHAYLAAFGFGKPTGLGLSAESSGVLRPAKEWREINLATISFGHGVTVTALQQALAMGAIANGGTLYAPRLVKKIIGADGSLKKEYVPEVVNRPISQKTAKKVTEMLMHVTRKGGTATKAALADYAVAGKTGTAQKVVNGGYQSGTYIASFVGFAPAQDPKLVISVVLDDPKGQYYGGQVSAPVFKAVMEESLRSMGVPAMPDPEAEIPKSEMESQPLVVTQPASMSTSLPASVPISTRWQDRFSQTMPDFTGLTIQESLQLARAQKLELFIEGTGLAIAQNPPVKTLGATSVSVVFQERGQAPVQKAPTSAPANP
jgi:cell division protein FtsI (penicillin-binding protein 3)